MVELPRKIRNSSLFPIKVFLKMTEIDGIELSWASHIDGPLLVDDRHLSIDASGASNISLAGDSQKVEMDISGASNVSFVGKVTEMEGNGNAGTALQILTSGSRFSSE